MNDVTNDASPISGHAESKNQQAPSSAEQELTANRRLFWRAAFRSPVNLVGANSAGPAQLLDISLRGALVEVPGGWPGAIGERYRIELDLGEDAAIAMLAIVSHIENRKVGLRCESIDLDSITHLRRLVALISGDTAMLDRELSVLLAD